MPSRLAPAERVKRLRLRYGSHDKLAAALAERSGGALAPNRQAVIRWEKGGGISEGYAVLLAELDRSSPELFRPPAAPRQFQAIRREVLRLAAEVADVHDEVTALREAVEAAGIELPESP